MQNGNTHAISSKQGISHVNQRNEKCFLAVLQDERQKDNHLKGMYGYGGSFCMRPGKHAMIIVSLKCLYTSTHSMDNKHEELDIWMQ